MKPINVLIIEQNLLARQAIAGTLRKHPQFNVTGVFGDVDQIELKVRKLNPDAILLDIEAKQGFEMLKSLRKSFPNCPVIVLSRRTPEGAELVLEALEAGAVDFITKPRFGQNLLFASAHLTKRLIPIIKMTARLHAPEGNSGYTERKLIEDAGRETLRKKDLKRTKPRVIVIGACTGGPASLSRLISQLPENFDIPVIIVQHFPKYFTAELAEMLNRQASLEVKEAVEGARLEPGTVWIAPGGYHCEISGWSCKPFLKVHKGPRELDARPSINNLFRSAANIYGREVLAILLSGHGEDGFEGLESINRAGGMVVVQHPDTAPVPDLPRQALKAGLADYQMSLDRMAEMLSEISNANSYSGEITQRFSIQKEGTKTMKFQ